MKSKERVKREQVDGAGVREKISRAKRVTAGILFKSGSTRVLARGG